MIKVEKIVLSRQGSISIEKYGWLRTQYCPYTSDQGGEADRTCGIECPMHGEVELADMNYGEEYRYILNLCNDTFIIAKDFENEFMKT